MFDSMHDDQKKSPSKLLECIIEPEGFHDNLNETLLPVTEASIRHWLGRKEVQSEEVNRIGSATREEKSNYKIFSINRIHDVIIQWHKRVKKFNIKEI